MKQWVLKKVMMFQGEGLDGANLKSNLAEFSMRLHPQGGMKAWKIKIRIIEWKSYQTALIETSITGQREGCLLMNFFDCSV